MAETVWYRHTNGTVHEIVKGSEQHKRMAREMTVVDELSDEIPEPVYAKLSDVEVKRLKGAELPGALKNWRKVKNPTVGTTVIQQAGPSEADIQARIDEAVQAAVTAAVAALVPQNAPDAPAAETTNTTATTAKGK